MKLLLLSLLLLTGCAVEEYEPVELPSDDCLIIGVCTEMSVLLYDKIENSEFIIDKDGNVNIETNLVLQAQENRISNPSSDSNDEGLGTIHKQLDFDYFGERLHDNKSSRPKIITNKRIFENK